MNLISNFTIPSMEKATDLIEFQTHHNKPNTEICVFNDGEMSEISVDTESLIRTVKAIEFVRKEKKPKDLGPNKTDMKNQYLSNVDRVFLTGI